MDFHLVTRWHIPAPREAVFGEIEDPSRWPGWWPGMESATERRPGDEHGIGRAGEIVWRAPVGYKVRFEIESRRVEPPRLLEGVARGDLSGVGVWTFEPAGPDGLATDVTFDWRVDFGKPFVRRVVPVLRRFLVWNHDRLMARGEAAFQAHLSHTDADSP